MIELSVIRDLVTIFGVLAGFSYYVLTVRNAQRNQQQQLETRQAQLLMNIMNTFRSKEFRTQWHKLFELKIENIESVYREYRSDIAIITAWTSVLAYFDSIGVLVKNGMISVELIHSLMASSVLALWETFGSFILLDREDVSTFILSSKASSAWDDVEYLYNEIIKYEETLQKY